MIESNFEDEKTGAIYICEKNQNRLWGQTTRIQPNDIGQGELFGISIAIDDDVIIVGTFVNGNEGHGSSYVYRWKETTWME